MSQKVTMKTLMSIIEEMQKENAEMKKRIEVLESRKGKIVNIGKPNHPDLLEGQRFKHTTNFSAYYGIMRGGVIRGDDGEEFDSLTKFALYHYKVDGMEYWESGKKRTCNGWTDCYTELVDNNWVKASAYRDAKEALKEKVRIHAVCVEGSESDVESDIE